MQVFAKRKYKPALWKLLQMHSSKLFNSLLLHFFPAHFLIYQIIIDIFKIRINSRGINRFQPSRMIFFLRLSSGTVTIQIKENISVNF